MKKTFTILIAAIAAILMMTLPEKVVGQTTYSLATSLSVNDRVIMTNIDFTKELTGVTTSGTTIGTASDIKNSTPAGTYILTVVAGNTNGSFAFKTVDNTYLSWSSGNSLTTSSSVDNASSWTVQIVSTGNNTGNATVTNVGTTDRILSYNSSSPRFACYGNANQQRVRFYKQVSSGPTQLAAPTNFSATAGNAQATFSWTAVDHASNYTIVAKNGDTWDNPTVLFDNASLTNGQYVGTGLTNGTTYVCKVRANGDGTNYSNSALSEATATFTPTSAQQYTVSIADGITGGTVGANPTTATAGTTIQVTANATAGYNLTALSYTDGQSSTNIDLQTLQFTMPSSNVTINATFTPFTVTLSANGSTSTWNVTMNNGNIPDADAPCAAWSFYKWSTSAMASQATTAPTTTVNATGYKPTGNITLYAVYKKTEGGASFSNTSSGGNFNIYALVSDNNGTTPYYAKGTGSKIDSDTDSSNATTYTFEKPTNQNYGDNEYAIKTGSTYITYSSDTDLGTSTTTPYKWTITAGTKGTWRVTSGTEGRAFIFRAGTTNKFGGYSTSNVTANGTEYYDLEIGTPSTTYYHSTPDCTQTVETPTFDPDGGNFETTQTVHISCDTPEVSIFYTLNGVEPTNEASETNFAYNAQTGVSIATTTTLKAKAFKEGWYASATKSATYTIQHDVAEPTLPASQVFTTNIYSVEITVPANTTVYYTTNGDNPTNASTQYSTAFTIDATKTVKAIAYDGDGCASDVVSATYTRAYSLAAAKALYTNANVPNITINLVGVQFVAKSGSNTYVQQDEVGLMIYGSHSQNLTNGDVFTAGTVTGTITKYGQNMELSISTGAFVGVAKEAGILTASATGVTIPNITGNFSTYEDRFVSLTSLTMSVSGKTLTDTDSHTLAIYDPFNVLSETVQPNDNVVVTGIVTSYYKDSNTTYQIIPLAKSGISTGVAATLPTLDPVGGETAGEAVQTETVTITPATGTTVTYAFGEDYDEIDSETELTVPSTNATALELVVNRDFYTENTATYYYKTSATTYDVSFYVNGDEDPSLAKEVVEGGTLGALPTPTAPSGYTFRGWAQAEITGVQNNAPTMVSSTTTVNADMELYAVFAIQTNSEETVELTNSAITNYKSNNTTSYNDNYSINNWTGRYLVNNSSNTYYLQLGYNASTSAGAYNSHLTTPLCANNITSITISTNKGTSSGRTFFLCSASNLGTASSTNATYGSGSITADNGSVTINVSGNTKQFHIYPNGTAYIESVTLVCSAVTYSDYCTTVSVPSLPLDEGELTEDYTIPTGAAYTLTSPITVPSGITLTVPANAVFANADPANLIIADGGQLILPDDATVAATVQKEVSAASQSKDYIAPYGWYSISSSVNNASIEDNTNLITQDEAPYKFDLYRYNETASTNQWENYHANDDFTHMTNGRGYLYRNEDDITVEFTGTVNTGDVKYTVTKSEVGALAGFNLIGNPYTHDIYKGGGTALENSVTEGYELATGFYTVTNKGAWTIGYDVEDAEPTAINPGQGFLVQAVKAGQITMTNTDANGVSKANHDNIRFVVSNSQYEDATCAMFDKGNGLNKISHRNAEIPMLYIPQNDENYAIAMMDDNTQAFNLNFKAMTMGKYTLSYKAYGQFSYLHVIDRLTGEDVDMLLEESYSFVGTPKDAENRFIVKLNYQSGLDGSENSTFAYQSGNDIVVSGEGELQIFDVMGRMIATQNINGVETVNVPANGVYVFRLNEKVQKVVVK